MRKILGWIMAAALALLTAGCGSQPAEDAFTVEVRCESQGVYQLYYTYYLDGESCGMGGMADLDGRELTAETELRLEFSKARLDGREDIRTFAIDFSPYGKDDVREIGTTNRLEIPAEYGKRWVVVFSGDRETGYTAQLQEE